MAINLITGYNIYKDNDGLSGLRPSAYKYIKKSYNDNSRILNYIKTVQNCNVLNDNFNLI